MRKTLRWLLVALSLFVAILALGSILFSIGELRNSGERASGAEYSIIRNALTGIRTKEDLEDDFLRQRLIALYKGSDRLLAAQVLDASGLVLWKLPSDSAYFALPGSPLSRAGFSAPDWSTVVFTTPLNNGMKLATLFVTLRKADLARAVKTPLIFLSLWFGLMVVAFFVLGRDKSGEKVSDSLPPTAEEEKVPSETDAAMPPEAGAMAPPAEAETTPPAPGAEPSGGNQEVPPGKDSMAESEEQTRGKETPLPPAAKETSENQPAEEYEKEEYEEIEEEEFIGDEDVFEEKEEEKPAPRKNFEESLARLEEEIANWSSKRGESKTSPFAEEPVKAEEAQETREDIESLEAEEELAELEEFSRPQETEAEASAPMAEEKASSSQASPPQPASAGSTLASLPLPLSLIDPELEAKLREELERGPKAEVSLMLIHCSVNSATDPAALALAVTVRDYIGAKDLIFELYKGAFAVVLPSVDLGGSLKMSEDLADVLSATLGLYRDIEGDAPVYIGISAKSERKVDAFKLYREASTALHKAYEGGQSRILAFRPKVD